VVVRVAGDHLPQMADSGSWGLSLLIEMTRSRVSTRQYSQSWWPSPRDLTTNDARTLRLPAERHRADAMQTVHGGWLWAWLGWLGPALFPHVTNSGRRGAAKRQTTSFPLAMTLSRQNSCVPLPFRLSCSNDSFFFFSWPLTIPQFTLGGKKSCLMG